MNWNLFPFRGKRTIFSVPVRFVKKTSILSSHRLPRVEFECDKFPRYVAYKYLS